MTYRMASSTYLYRGQPAEEREPIQPHAALRDRRQRDEHARHGRRHADDRQPRGAPRRRTTSSTSTTPRGNRIYTHTSTGERVLDTRVALTEISMLKDVLTVGTARHELADFAALRPAAGKTGTQEKNWTAVFVGATPFLSTAVLVRDPARYTSMDDIPEFVAEGVDNVQGGTYPARIWGAFMEPAHVFEPVTDWPKPPPLSRPPARLYLPGVECLFRAGVDRDHRADRRRPRWADPRRRRRPGCAPAATSPSRRHRRRHRSRAADGHDDPRRSDGDDRAADAGVHGDRQRHDDPARRARSHVRRFRRHHGRSMLHRADDRDR